MLTLRKVVPTPAEVVPALCFTMFSALSMLAKQQKLKTVHTKLTSARTDIALILLCNLKIDGCIAIWDRRKVVPGLRKVVSTRISMRAKRKSATLTFDYQPIILQFDGFCHACCGA